MWFFVIVFAFLMRLKRLFNQNEGASYIVKKSALINKIGQYRQAKNVR